MFVVVCVCCLYVYILLKGKKIQWRYYASWEHSLCWLTSILFSLCVSSFLTFIPFPVLSTTDHLDNPFPHWEQAPLTKGCFPGYWHGMMGRCVVSAEHHASFVLQLLYQFILSCSSWRSFTFFSFFFPLRNRRWARQILDGFQETGISGSANVLYGLLQWFLNKEIGINSSYNVFYMLIGLNPNIFKIHFHYPLKIKRWSGSDTLDIWNDR